MKAARSVFSIMKTRQFKTVCRYSSSVESRQNCQKEHSTAIFISNVAVNCRRPVLKLEASDSGLFRLNHSLA